MLTWSSLRIQILTGVEDAGRRDYPSTRVEVKPPTPSVHTDFLAGRALDAPTPKTHKNLMILPMGTKVSMPLSDSVHLARSMTTSLGVLSNASPMRNAWQISRESTHF